MLKRIASLLLLFISLASLPISAAAKPSPKTSTTGSNFDGQSWWNYVKVLAADDMEGRETGSEGLRKAAAYIVEQLRRTDSSLPGLTASTSR